MKHGVQICLYNALYKQIHLCCAAGEDDVEGGLQFEQAVKLGLYNVKTGKMRDPLTGELISLQEAIDQGLLNPRGAAITDIVSGKQHNLRDAMTEGEAAGLAQIE